MLYNLLYFIDHTYVYIYIYIYIHSEIISHFDIVYQHIEPKIHK